MEEIASHRWSPPLFDANYGVIQQRLLACIIGAMDALLDRQTSSYPYLDTKFDISTSRDFSPKDPIRGKNTVYSWIQGRGLEAICDHGLWFETAAPLAYEKRNSLLHSIHKILPPIVDRMEEVRKSCGGMLPFSFAADIPGSGLIYSATSMSDLFYSRGLAAAGCFFRREDWLAEAIELFDRVVSDLRSGCFEIGQVAFDPRNPVEAISGRFSHAGRMIGIGGATLFYRCTGSVRYLDIGHEFISHILTNHVCNEASASVSSFERGDFWEFTDSQNQPWSDPQGRILSDPGHATEFVGLALAHLEHTAFVDPALRSMLAAVLSRNFRNGFTGIGIVKTFDLRKREPICSDMPWWSLPETMRAAALSAKCFGQEEDCENPFEEIFLRSESAFSANYLQQGRNHFAVQNLTSEGRIARAIPAIPDADPCYHTGLSMIGCMDWIETHPRKNEAIAAPGTFV